VNARAALTEDFAPSMDLVASGAVKLGPLITHVLPLAEAKTAIEMLKTSSEQRMKIILDNSGTPAQTNAPGLA
jgi:threonine dehydrogenase-like Zn-dependent dehydrogenase